MALVDSQGFAHVRLTVTDITRSKDFYDRLLGWEAMIDNSARAGEPGVAESREEFYGGVVYSSPEGSLLGLRPVGTQRFDSTTTGLDHVSLKVGSRAELVAAAAALDEAGIDHGEVTDLEGGQSILSIQDPDDINLELSAPTG